MTGTGCVTRRIRLIDIGKGAGVIGVVMVHAAASVFTGGSGASNPVVQFLYTFILMFFLMSGYVYRSGKTPKENIIRCAKRLIPLFIICSVVLTVLMWVYLLALGYDIPAEDMLNTLKGTLIGRITFMPMDYHADIIYGGLCNISFAFYFIVYLLVASIIFYLLVDKVSGSLKKTALAVLGLLVCEFILLSLLPVHLPYAIESCLVPAAVMLIGAYAAKRHILEDIEMNFTSSRRIVIFLVMLAVGILSSIYIPLTFGLSNARFGEYGAWSVFTCLITALSCGYVIFTVLAAVERIPVISSVFEYCGKHSLSIFMLHGFYLKAIAALFYTIPEEAVIVPLKTLPEAIAVGLVSIVLCLLTGYVLNRLVLAVKKMRTGEHNPAQSLSKNPFRQLLAIFID